MRFLNSAGVAVTQDEACYPGSTRIRPGYRSVMGDGEWMGFEVALFDSFKDASSVLMDTAQNRERAGMTSEQVRDYVRDTRYGCFVGRPSREVAKALKDAADRAAKAREEMIDDMTSAERVRNHVRDMRYL